jgi:glycosyltransferase involved in cell wall biosynthesis
MRVLHTPVNIGNQPWNLSRAERRLGVRSNVLTIYSTSYAFRSDTCLGKPGSRSPLMLARRLWHGISSPFRYDVLHYYFGRTLLCWDDYGPPTRLWCKDLALAKRLGRKVFMTLQGCDARLAGRSDDANEITMCRQGHCESYAACIATIDRRRQALIDTIVPRCDRVFYLNPELGHFVPGGQFLPYANVDVEAYEPVPPATEGPVRILHAPSDEGIKGTPYIVAALESLKKRYDIEFILVRGVPHAEALELYRSADLVIDQVLAGWYGGVAVEAMAMGKPVACYLRKTDLGVLPPAMRDELPLLDLRPDTIEQVIAGAIERRDAWAEWSARSRAFVRRWHHPDRIARAMVDAYRHPDSEFRLEDDPCAD